MPLAQLQFDGRGFKMVAGETRKAIGELKRRQDALVHEEAEWLLEFLRMEAPRKTGALADGFYLGTRRGLRDIFDMPFATVDIRQPQRQKLKWIVEGTRPHLIPKGGAAEMMAKGYPLSFYWARGPRGSGWYHFWQVHHPGTKKNPFVDRARDQWLPGAIKRFEDMGLQWSRNSFVSARTAY